MGIDNAKLFGEFYDVYSSETYDETIGAAEHLTSTSLLLLSRKTEGERRDILAKVEALTGRLNDTICEDAPLVVALALLNTVCAVERLVQSRAGKQK
jgi:hypothetical protein